MDDKQESVKRKHSFWKDNKTIITVGILSILIIIIALGLIIFKMSNSEMKANEDNRDNLSTTSDFNGTYKFTLEDDNGYGYTFFSKGVIAIDNEKCTIKFIYGSDTITPKEYSLDGYCGINVDDNTFKLVLLKNTKNEFSTYKCVKDGNNLKCTLNSDYNLVGCEIKKDLLLEYIGQSVEKDSLYANLKAEWEKQWQEEKQAKEKAEKERKEAEEKAEREKKEAEEKAKAETFKNECSTITYEGLARNPDNVKENKVKLTGEVIQVMEAYGSTSLRVDITKSKYGYYSDTVYITYTPKSGEDRILEDDIVTIWGTAKGNYSYTSVMGATITLPRIDAEYIEINK